MRDFIKKQIIFHCDVYEKDYVEIIKKYENYDKSDSFSLELINIYKDMVHYEKTFDTIEKILDLEKNFKSNKKIKELIEEIDLILGKNFTKKFFIFSLINEITEEIYDDIDLTYEKNLSIIDIVDNIKKDFILFTDFMYVNKKLKSNIDEEKYSKEIKKIIFRIILILIEKEILIKKKIVVYNKERGELKNSVFIFIKEKKRHKNLSKIFRIGKDPAFIKERDKIRLIGFLHYSNNIHLISKKPFKGESVLKEEFIRSITNRAKIKFFVDDYMIEVIEKRINEEFEIGIEKELKKIKKLNSLKQSVIDNKEIYDNFLEEIEKIKKKISKVQKDLSIQIEIWLFKNLKEYLKDYNDGLFFIPHSDFRGRIYYNSKVSPQSNWIFRFLYNFGKTDIIDYSNSINLNLSNELKKELETLKIKEDSPLIWIFISLGFLYKKKINKKVIILEEFLFNGIYLYKNFKENKIYKELENDKATEAIYYMKIIEDHMNGQYIKRYVFKDSTASVYQHLGKILLFKDKKSLEITNLRSNNTWIDTYEPFIEEGRKIIDPESEKYFTRSNLKKSIFTIKYNIGSKNCFEYFKENLEFIPSLEYSKLASSFQKFYIKLKKGDLDESLLYKKKLKDVKKDIEDKEYLSLEDILVNLKYYKKEKRDIVVFEKGKRHTMTDYQKSKEIDKDKSRIALEPNVMHSLDGLFARKVFNKCFEKNIEITVNHDSFGAPYYKIDLLIIFANESMEIEKNPINPKETNEKLEELSSVIII